MPSVQVGIHINCLTSFNRWFGGTHWQNLCAGGSGASGLTLGLSQLTSSLPKVAWLQAHVCSLYNYKHAYSHQHLLNRQLTGRKIISNNLAYHHSSWWHKVTHMEDNMFTCDLHLRQQEEGQNSEVQGQQNAICRVSNFRPKRCSLEGGSSGDLNKAAQSRDSLDFPLAHC